MIGQVLGRLGESGLAASLAILAEAARIGAPPLSPETEGEIQSACEALRDMRVRLAALENRGIEVVLAIARPENQRTHDFRPPPADPKPQ